MKLSDAPHAVGTPEHSAWVRNVFIPTVDAERAETDGELYGAPSIGARMILGAGHYDPDLWRPEGDVFDALEGKAKDYERRMFERLFVEPNGELDIGVVRSGSMATNQFTVFFETFEGVNEESLRRINGLSPADQASA